MRFPTLSSIHWITPFCGLAIAALITSGAINLEAQRRGGGGGRVNPGAARTSIRSTPDVNRSVNANRDFNQNVNRDVNRNINRDVDIDRDIDIDRDVDFDMDYDRWGHPIARGVARGVAIGTAVALLPSGCSTVMVNGLGYSQCGSTWYQPYYGGTTVQYVVVNPPQ